MPTPTRPAVLPPSSATATAASAPTSLADRIIAALSSWSRRRSDRAEAAVEELAGLVAEAAGSEVIASALVRLAYRAAGPGAVRAELWHGRSRIAAWPAASDPDVAGIVVELPLRCGGEGLGTLRITTDGSRPISNDRRRRLATLAVLAAAADRSRDREAREHAVASESTPATHPTHDPMTGLPNAMFLDTFLGYALALVERRDEPLSLLYIGVDRLAAIHGLHGPAVAGEALRKASRTVARSLRSSDLIARLDDSRLVAVLPGTSAAHARVVAELIRSTVASTCAATPSMPFLTVSIGVASFPEHAGDLVTLRSAAAASLADARSRGRDRVASAPDARLAAGAPTLLRIVQNAG
jgi:diguanylate cyclase (GGDEF)-like protein